MKHRLLAIKLLLLDVDGVLTDGRIIYTDSGEQVKAFHASDGLGLRLLLNAGIKVGLITGRKATGALKHRLDNLGIDLIFDGIIDKASVLDEIRQRTGIPAEETAYAGDDLIDLPVLTRAGLAVAVANACDEVKAKSHLVLDRRGGSGAVRELCEILLKAQGLWQPALDRFMT